MRYCWFASARAGETEVLFITSREPRTSAHTEHTHMQIAIRNIFPCTMCVHTQHIRVRLAGRRRVALVQHSRRISTKMQHYQQRQNTHTRLEMNAKCTPEMELRLVGASCKCSELVETERAIKSM